MLAQHERSRIYGSAADFELVCCHNPTRSEFNSLRSWAGRSPWRYVMLKRVIRAAICPRPDCRRPRLFPEPHWRRCRNPRPSTTSGCPEAEAAQAAVAPFGSALLDGLAGDLVSLEGCTRNRQSRNGRRLASSWFPAVLALEIPAAWRPADDQ